MSLRRALRPVVVLLALLGASLPRASADRAAADFFVQRAERAQRERKGAEAQDLFRKALEEDDSHVPARMGLAESLYGAGDRAGALEALRRVVAASAGGAPLPPAWGELAVRAKARVAELEAAETTLGALLDRRVGALLDLATRWKEKDPDVAARALRDALRLRPMNEAAKEALRAMGGTTSSEWTTLFDGQDMAGFEDADPEAWKVAGGLMVGDVPGRTYMITSKQRLHGDFDLRMEARITKEYAAKRILFLCGAIKGPYECTQVGLLFKEMVTRETNGRNPDEAKYTYKEFLSNLPPSYDVASWLTYELQFRGEKVRFVLNGALLAETDRAPNREEGTAGIMIQDVRVEVRRFAVIQR